MDMGPPCVRRVDRRLRCGIVTKVTEWAATVDRRYHDAVILGLDSVITETASGTTEIIETRDSTVPLLRRLRDVGVATAIYSSARDCAQVLRAAGIVDLVSLVVDEAETAAKPHHRGHLKATGG